MADKEKQHRPAKRSSRPAKSREQAAEELRAGNPRRAVEPQSWYPVDLSASVESGRAGPEADVGTDSARAPGHRSRPQADLGPSASAGHATDAGKGALPLGPRLAPPPARQPERTLDHLRLPPLSDVRCTQTTRLLPAKYSESVLTRITDDLGDLQLLFTLEHATNDRLLAEGNQQLGIAARELVFEVPHCRIINAAFTHPHPLGGRFSTPYRGAWYAGLELATAKAEVLFHRAVQFAEINWQQMEELEYDQYTADFTGCFHDLRPEAFNRAAPAACQQGEPGAAPALELVERPRLRKIEGGLGLWASEDPEIDPGEKADTGAEPLPRDERPGKEPVHRPPTVAEFVACLAPDSYIWSQQLTIDLLDAGSLGILYPSARRSGGSCIACFRPSLVTNVRKRDLYRLRWYPDRAATFVRSPRATPAADAPAVAGARS